MSIGRVAAWIALSAAVASACDDAAGAPPCGHVSESYAEVLTPKRVALLFVVDGSRVSAEAHAALAAATPRLMRILASGDFNEDGDTLDYEDFRPPQEIRAGVITTDMGTGGHAVPTCPEPDFGDDGVLRTLGPTVRGACMATYPSFLRWDAAPSYPPDALASDLACVMQVGANGCGIEQPLEAILKALSPRSPHGWTAPDYLAPGHPDAPEGLARPFFRQSQPHGDFANAGFMDDAEIHVFVVLTDDDDCSFFDPRLFDPAGPYAATPLALRCAEHPEALHPVERYVNGLLQLHRDPRNLVFVPIAGIPVELASPPGVRPDWDRLTSPDCETDPSLCPRIDPSAPRLAPSCEGLGGMTATPPSRLLRAARGLDERGARVTVQSICQESFADALLAVADHIRPALSRECLPSDLRVEADGRAACDVHVVMPEGMHCDLDGYAPVRDEHGEPVREHDRALCVLHQLVPDASAPGGIGWFYDTFTEDRQRACGTRPRIAFAGTRPPRGAELRLECSTPLEAIAPGHGTPCEPSAPDPCGDLRTIEGAALACDPLVGACGVPCEITAQCWEAGLVNFVCDPPEDPDATGFCFDPSCG